MRIDFTSSLFAVALTSTLAVLAIGCTKQTADPETTAVSNDASTGHDHSGWWCGEHGIPEEECSMCSKKAADEFKAKGDWCEEHNRAESQCFKCDPTRAEKFAKLHQAKFGYAPPEPTE